MDFKSQKGGARAWAWIGSICAHVILFIAFSLLSTSKSTSTAAITTRPLSRINRQKQITEAEPIIPKPQITKRKFSRSFDRATLPATIAKQDQVSPVAKKPGSLSHLAAGPIGAMDSSGAKAGRVEFFHSSTYERKICYVVDCSGSMQGLFNSVRRKLKASIKDLQPDQYFNVIFFGSDKLYQFSNGKLTRATQQSKAAAEKFIDSVVPSGGTNAFAALAQAMRVRDSLDQPAGAIYFLTDGFELTQAESDAFLFKLLNMKKNLAPNMKIHALGFWAQASDCNLLKKIGEQSGGSFVHLGG